MNVRLLVLGGTAWLGGAVTMAALDRGDDVTCLARGTSGSAPEGARFVPADRDRPDAYDEVAESEWEAVIDVSRQPGQVRRATAALGDHTRSFIFVSSCNVYAETTTPGQDEHASLLPPLDGDVMETMESYGEAKVASEHHVLDAFGAERSLIARVGLIGGPGDIFGRTGYWPLRFHRPAAADGCVLVPDVPDLLTQVIDVRDLAAWLVEGGRTGLHGIFNAGGETISFAEHLEAARSVAGHTGPVVAAPPEWLVEHGVQPWMGERSLPLWLPLPDYAGFNAHDNGAAHRAGLIPRPLEATLADTLAWELEEGPPRPRPAGLSDEDERSLLAALER